MHNASGKCKLLRIRALIKSNKTGFKLFACSIYLLQKMKLFSIHLPSWRSVQKHLTVSGFCEVKVQLEYCKNQSCTLARPSISSKSQKQIPNNNLVLVSSHLEDNRPIWLKEDGRKGLTLFIIFSFCQEDYPNTKPGTEFTFSISSTCSLSPKLLT